MSEDGDKTGIDRRESERHLACFPAFVEEMGTEGEPRSALIHDLSVTGALLLTRAKLDVGDDVKLMLHLEGDKTPLAVSAKVVRVERRTSEMAHPWTRNVAVQFEEAMPQVEEAAKQIASRQAALRGHK